MTEPPGDHATPVVRGADLARAALEAARSGAAARARNQPRRRRVAGAPRYSGARPDDTDPQRFGTTIDRLVADRGWTAERAAASVLGRWEHLVGPDIAAHCQPESLHQGVLVLAAESTAWATQLRLLAGRLEQRIRAELGPGVVTSVRVHGPTGPSWRSGPRTVRGRGPRDTYG